MTDPHSIPEGGAAALIARLFDEHGCKHPMFGPVCCSLCAREIAAAALAQRETRAARYPLIRHWQRRAEAAESQLALRETQLEEVTKEREHYHAHYEATLFNWSEALTELSALRTVVEQREEEIRSLREGK
jgi:hypothetical protein